MSSRLIPKPNANNVFSRAMRRLWWAFWICLWHLSWDGEAGDARLHPGGVWLSHRHNPPSPPPLVWQGVWRVQWNHNHHHAAVYCCHFGHFVFKTLFKNCLLAIAASWQNQWWLKFLEIPVLALLAEVGIARFVFPCFYLAIVDGIPIEQIGNLKNEEYLKILGVKCCFRRKNET